MKKIALVIALLGGMVAVDVAVSHAQGSGSAVAADGSAAPTPAAPAAAPADQLHDPVAQPLQALDDLKAAKKLGWGVAIFAALALAFRLLGLAKSVSFLAWLGKGKTATVLAGAGAVILAVYNALASGGAWMAALGAAGAALLHYIDGGAKAA